MNFGDNPEYYYSRLVKELKEENNKLREALKKIADPRLRDHKEPDLYTELGCIMNIANEALKE